MLKTFDSKIAMRMTALAIALVFCIGMFSPLVAVAGTAEAPAIEARQPTSLLGNEPAESLAAEPQPEMLAAPVPVEPNTIIIQPNATAGKDTLITTEVPHNENSFGEWDQTLVGNGSYDYRGLLQFDVPSTIGTVKSATLSAYQLLHSGSPVNVSVHGISSPWWEGAGAGVVGTANWTHRAGYSNDFEVHSGYVSSTNDWVWGDYGPWVGVEPNSVPPPSAHSGTKMWGTVLNSEYNNLGAESTLTFMFNIDSAISNPTLSFWDWYDVFENFDHGEVYVNGDMVLDRETSGAYVVPTAWVNHVIDLSTYSGQIINVEFRLWQTTVVNRAGWYIDDLQVISAATPWNKPGGDYYPTPSSYQTVANDICWYSWNVTSIVQNWATDTWQNNGFIMVGDNPDPAQYNIAWFYTSDYSDPSYRPKLTISYAAEITDPVDPQVFLEDAPARTIPLNGRGAGTVETISGVDAFSGAGSAFPLNGAGADQMHFQVVYNATQVGSEGVIRSLAFKRANPSDVGSFSNFKIMMAHTDKDVLDVTFADNYQGFLIEVFKEATVFVNSSNNDPWIHFNLNGNFTYDSKYNLLIDIQWNGDSGATVPLLCSSSTTTKRIWDTSGNPSGTTNNNPNVARFLVDVVDNAVYEPGTVASWSLPFSDNTLERRVQLLYNHTFVNQGGVMDKLSFQYNGPTTYINIEDLSIRMAHSRNDTLDANFNQHTHEPWIEVFNRATFNVSVTASGEWFVIDIDNVFTYNNVDNLLIDIRYRGPGSGVILFWYSAFLSYDCAAFSEFYNSETGTTDTLSLNAQFIFADSPHLTWSATSSDPSMFTASVTPGTRNLVITPQPDQFGTGTVSLRLTNTMSGVVATQLVSVTINAVNDGPILAAIPNQNCIEDIPMVLNVAPYMSDIDDDIYSLVVTTNSPRVAVVGTNLTFLYPEGWVGETVAVTIRDPGGLTDTKSFVVNVTQINDVPHFTGFPATATCDATVHKAINLNPLDEETATNNLLIFTSSEYINVTGHTLHLLYPKGIGTEIVTVYLVDELTYGTQNNVSYTMVVTIIDHPEVVVHAPTGTSVPIISPVRVTFDMPMNATKAESAFSMKLGTTAISGNFTWNANGTVMTFTPAGMMVAGTYDVSVAASAESADGIKMLGAFSWNFTVAYGDYDGDGMPDEWEIQYGLDPTANDADGDLDGDGMPNLWEYENSLNPAVNDADGDADGDGATNLEEYLAGTDPNDPDSKPSDFSWLIWILILAIVAGAVIMLVILMKRGKKPAPESQGQQQEGEYPPPPGEPYYPPPEGQAEPMSPEELPPEQAP